MITTESVTEGGLVGTLCIPTGPPAPGVLCLGGSEGGHHAWHAEALANRGFTALSLAYAKNHFDPPTPEQADLPEAIANIPLEYCEQALTWLAAHPAVRGNRVAVMGYSRGGELALQLGSMFPVVSNVVAVVPSGVRWGAAWSDDGRAAWTYKGKPLPYLDNTVAYNNSSNAEAELASISVERIKGPVLLVSGGDDKIWPSTDFSDAVMKRLEAKGHTACYDDRHLNYPFAGHFAGGPPSGYSISEEWRAMVGGNESADLHAQRSSWRVMLSFMRQHTVDLGVSDVTL
jgi:dienelactone hydrolase